MFIVPSHLRKTILLFCSALLLGACAPAATPAPIPSDLPAPPLTNTPSPAATAAPSSYNDPFAYCAAVGTVDTPDTRYTGDKLPDSLVQGMIKKNIVSADAPPEFQHNALWRCMNNNVWVCSFGANLPCDEKADTSSATTAAMDDFCKTNPSADGIPAAVTGHDTIYEWVCKDGKAQVGKQLLTVDPQGYIAQFWYELSPQ